MVSNKWKKTIKSLHAKKHRKNSALFLVEGEKVFLETVNSDLNILYAVVSERVLDNAATDQWSFEWVTGADQDINALSTLVNNYTAIAVVEMPERRANEAQDNSKNIILLLDDVRDPGNLGTIIRTADWYGIRQVICSPSCVDFYNSKVISATMGSFTRLIPEVQDLELFLTQPAQKNRTVLGAFMEGESIHSVKKEELNGMDNGVVLIMGNESNGVGEYLNSHINKKVSIPGASSAESLNVAIATSILCDNLVRILDI